MTENLFKNQTVAITGGMGDIGQAMALEFARAGANVALCGNRKADTTIDFIKKLTQFGVSANYQSVDVANSEMVEHWLNDVENLLGVPQLIIANAATVTLKKIHEVSAFEWAKEININLNGAFYFTQYATARLLAKKLPGRVVFIGSWAGQVPHQHIPAYCVAKAGMRMLCKCLALELAPHHILVNELAPGFVQAGLSAKVWEENPEMNDAALQKVPIKKIMTAEEVAVQVIRLCHPDNIHMTGGTILMDGGLSLLS